MFTGTHKLIPSVFFILCLALTACSTGTRPGETGDKAALPQPIKNSTVPSAAYGDSVLMYEWREGTDPSLLHLIDPRTGLDIPGHAPIPLGKSYAYAISPDQNTLAVIVYPSNNAPIGGRLDLINLQTWQVVTTTVEIDRWNTQMTISPDNQKLAIATRESLGISSQGNLSLVDIAQKAAIAQAEFEFLPTHIRFTSDSGALMIYGSDSGEPSSNPPSPTQIALLSLPHLDIAWSSTLPDILDGFVPNERAQATNDNPVPGPGDGSWMQPAVIFAPDKDNLYIVHADKDRLTTVDFTHHKVETVDIRLPVSLLDRFMALTAGVAYAKTPDGNFKTAAISPDGQRLYILVNIILSTQNAKTGMWVTSQTPLGLKVAQTSDGVELSHLDTQATDIAISAEGDILYLRSWGENNNSSAPFTEIWDIPHHNLLARLDGQYVTPSRQFNGKPILLSNSMVMGQTIQATLDAQTFSVLHEWSGGRFYGDWLVMP